MRLTEGELPSGREQETRSSGAAGREKGVPPLLCPPTDSTSGAVDSAVSTLMVSGRHAALLVGEQGKGSRSIARSGDAFAASCRLFVCVQRLRRTKE